MRQAGVTNSWLCAKPRCSAEKLEKLVPVEDTEKEGAHLLQIAYIVAPPTFNEAVCLNDNIGGKEPLEKATAELG